MATEPRRAAIAGGIASGLTLAHAAYALGGVGIAWTFIAIGLAATAVSAYIAGAWEGWRRARDAHQETPDE